MPLTFDATAIERARPLARAVDALIETFTLAKRELDRVLNDPRLRGANFAIGELEEASRFQVTFAGVTLVYRFSVAMDSAGVPGGRVEIFELTNARPEPEKLVETIRFKQSGQTDWTDHTGSPGDLGYWMPEIVIQVVEKVLRSRGLPSAT